MPTAAVCATDAPQSSALASAIWVLVPEGGGPLWFHIGLEVADSGQNTQLRWAFMTCATFPSCTRAASAASQVPQGARKHKSVFIRGNLNAFFLMHIRQTQPTTTSHQAKPHVRTDPNSSSHGSACVRSCVRADRLWGHGSTPMHAVHACRMSRFPCAGARAAGSSHKRCPLQ